MEMTNQYQQKYACPRYPRKNITEVLADMLSHAISTAPDVLTRPPQPSPRKLIRLSPQETTTTHHIQMSNNSTFFDPSAFLLAFNGREELLEQYLNSIPAADISIQRPVMAVTDFATHIAQCPPRERLILTSGLMEADGLVSHRGHERMLSVLRAAGRSVEESRNLPTECLALWILIHARDLFDSALSTDQFGKSGTLAVFQLRASLLLTSDRNAAMNRFRGEMAARCGEKYGSSRILLRRLEDRDTVVVGFYFEKFPATRRRLEGSETNPQLAATEERPIQFDSVRFDPSTGVLIVHSSYGALTGQIREAFSTAFLSDPQAYEWPEASRILQLSELIEQDQPLRDTNGREVLLTEIDYSIHDDGLSARYSVSGSDVLEICRLDGSLERVRQSHISKLCVRIYLERPGRHLKVTLTAPNKLAFRGTHEIAYIIAQLRSLNVLQIQEIVSAAA